MCSSGIWMFVFKHIVFYRYRLRVRQFTLESQLCHLLWDLRQVIKPFCFHVLMCKIRTKHRVFYTYSAVKITWAIIHETLINVHSTKLIFFKISFVIFQNAVYTLPWLSPHLTLRSSGEYYPHFTDPGE